MAQTNGVGADGNGPFPPEIEHTGEKLACPCCGSHLTLRKTNRTAVLEPIQAAGRCRPRPARCSSIRTRT